jgi:hypothetical protein
VKAYMKDLMGNNYLMKTSSFFVREMDQPEIPQMNEKIKYDYDNDFTISLLLYDV